MTAGTETAPAHSHLWVSQPVTGVTFDWKCDGCGEVVTLEWRPEFAGLGFEDLGRVVAAEHGGTVAVPGVITLSPEDAAVAASRSLDLMIGHPYVDAQGCADLSAIREQMKADGLYREPADEPALPREG